MSFVIERTFDSQFYKIYQQRLAILSPLIRKNAACVLDTTEVVFKDTIACVASDECCFVVGVVYVETSAKRNVIEEITKDAQPKKYRREEAVFYLEDNSGRAKIIWQCEEKDVVTGIVIGVCCSYTSNKELIVSRILFPGVAKQKKSNAPNKKGTVAFVSGLDFGFNQPLLDRQLLLFDWLEGALRDEAITEVVFLGGLIHSTRGEKEKKYGQSREFSTQQFDLLDTLLASLCKKDIKVHCVPGENDPTCFLLPQQAIHRHLFPLTEKNTNLFMHTNPSWIDLDGISLLCVSGQPLNDLETFFPSEESHSILEKTLFWQNIAPTAPDTLPCYSSENSDPFTVLQTPQIYISSTRSSSRISRCKTNDGETLILSLSRYSKTGSIFLVKRNTLAVSEITIDGVS